MTAPPMAYFGGKTRLASRIAAVLPPHGHYVEPFAGSLAVLLAKSPGRMETVNDIDDLLMTFWRVLRDRPVELARACALTPHSRAEYFNARTVDLQGLDELERARLVWVQIAQGFGGTLRKTGWRAYVDPSASSRGMPGYLEGYVDRMAAVAERLHHVSLECRPALELIASYGSVAECCLYVDPPYLGSTRSGTGGASYRIDMRNEVQHVELIEALLQCRASVVVSGYPSDLYDTALTDWHRVDIPTMTGQGGTYQRRLEVIWSNRAIAEPTLFDLEVTA